MKTPNRPLRFIKKKLFCKLQLSFVLAAQINLLNAKWGTTNAYLLHFNDSTGTVEAFWKRSFHVKSLWLNTMSCGSSEHTEGTIGY